jgi:hypothetical protein
MGIKIAQTGLMFVFLLVIPSLCKGYDPPFWLKAAIIIPGFGGVIAAFVGGLMAIWGI